MTPRHPGSAILVADDEPQLLRLIERVLQRARYDVVTAGDGAQALQQLDAQGAAIGVVLLDAAIVPRGAGEILAAAAQAAPPPAVVLMSGDALEPALCECLIERDGVFLRKPFHPAALLRAVEDSLAGEGS